MWPKCYTHFTARKQKTDNNSFPKYDPYWKAKAQLYEKVIHHNDLNGSIHLSTDGNPATVVCTNYSVYSGGDNSESTE